MILDELNSRTDYEMLLLEDILNILSENLGVNYRYAINFKNHKYYKHITDYSASYRDSIIHGFIKDKLVPLVLLESFKLIDMFIEYTLDNNLDINEKKVPWQFQEKTRMIDDKLKMSNINLHQNIELDIFKGIYNIYKYYKPQRSKIVHTAFDYNQLVFDDIIKLSKIAFLLIKIVNSDKNSFFFEAKKNTLCKALSEINISQFTWNNNNNPIILYYNIIYELDSNDNEIKLDIIKDKINIDINYLNNLGKNNIYTAIFKLTIKNSLGIWEIPSNILPETNVIKLENFTNFKKE